MSRNFELLSRINLEKLRPASEYVAEPDVKTPDFPKPNLQTRTHAELNRLVQRLFLSSAIPRRSVVFTGTGPDVGCTCVTVQTAEVLSCQTAANICLLDTNVNSSKLRAHFNLPDGPGFGDALVSGGPVHSFVSQVRNKLWVIAGGGARRDDLLHLRARLEAFLSELQKQFEYVLIDTPALSKGPGTSTLAALTDGAVLILKAGHTRRPEVRLVMSQLEASGVKLLGTILNQRDYPIPESIYRML